LKARGIKTVIVCGTSFQGVGIGTGGGAAQRGYKVVIPIDCLSSEDPYMEQYATYHLFKGGPAVRHQQCDSYAKYDGEILTIACFQ